MLEISHRFACGFTRLHSGWQSLSQSYSDSLDLVKVKIHPNTLESIQIHAASLQNLSASLRLVQASRPTKSLPDLLR